MTDSRKEVELPWTGERYLPEVGGNIELEHLHRYLLASRYTSGQRVLDIACGEGYGTALLAQTAASVVGVDIASEAVDHAAAKYQSRNLSFKTGSCAAIPLPDHCVDVVVSFETIEHHDQHDEMLREIKRVLVPNGLLVISSPDRLEYSDKPGTKNEYHVKELYRDEFESLLATYFQFHRISGQRVVYGSAIFDEESVSRISSFGVTDKVLLPAPGLCRPLYFLAVASDRELPVAESGILEQPIEASDNVKDVIRQVREALQTVSERDAQIVALNSIVAERDAKIVALNSIVTERDAQIVALNGIVAERDESVANVTQALKARDDQVRTLDGTVAERDSQAVALSLSVADGHERIAKLVEVAAGRDARIVDLDHALAERDTKIVDLGHAMAIQDEEINTLKQAVAERAQQAAALDRLVNERESEITGLTHAAADLDGQLAKLGKAVGQRDEHIAELEEAVRDRETQIDSLDRALDGRNARLDDSARDIADRDRQIASFETSVAELGRRIEHLIRWVAERTERIGELHDGLAARDGHIADLGQQLAHRDRQIDAWRKKDQAMSQSLIGRLTLPLRLLAGPEHPVPEPSPVIIDRSTAPVPFVAKDPVSRIRLSPLFDQAFYNLKNPDVFAADIDPATHYFLTGWMEHRDPSEHFSTRFYLQRHPDVAAAGINPLLHYIETGQGEGRQIAPVSADCESAGNSDAQDAIDVAHQNEVDEEEAIRRIQLSPLYDRDFYVLKNPDVLAGGIDPARHYFVAGWKEHRDPSEHFSTRVYLRDNPDIAAAGMNPLLHYIDSGQAEGRPITPSIDRVDTEVDIIAGSGLFDTAYYLAMNPDIKPEDTDPLRHYCEHGWREGRNPSADFDTRAYLDAYSDIKSADLNPFCHYVISGATEGRQSTFDPKSRFEDEAFFGPSTSEVQLVAYFADVDWDGVQRAHNASAGQRLLPHDDFGFYTAADGVTLGKQALLARRHGISGWCFSLDASGGSQDPDALSLLMATRDIDIGFCVDVKLGAAAMAAGSIARLREAMDDDRYFRIDGRPVLVMTLPEDDNERTTALNEFDTCVLTGDTLSPYRIVRLGDSAHQVVSEMTDVGVDAYLRLPIDALPSKTGTIKPINKNGVDTIPYSAIVSQGIARMRTPLSAAPVYQAVTMGRDDSPIDPSHPLIYSRFHLKDYRRWLDAAVADARAKHRSDRRFLFLNAWNDWNVGAVLEPDRIGGYGKLNETSRALLGMASGRVLPKVTVIVPNYNHSLYLPRRLESIYRQTYRNIEVLLLDDCSTDQSRALLSEYADRHRDCTTLLFNTENSGGVFRQWAKGIKAASGDLIWIAESDDYCDENFLEELVRCFDDEAVMLAFSNVEFVRADESLVPNEFSHYVRDLPCGQKWKQSYVNSAHQEVREALGIINTIPNASGAIFRCPVDLPLLESQAWLSMAVVGDWLFYLHLIRGGKIAFCAETSNYFRRYDSSTAASTYHKEKFYRELGIAAQTVQLLYDVPEDVMLRNRRRSKELYNHYCNTSAEEFADWFDDAAILKTRSARTPNILISTMAFHPGGAEILPIRIANELKRAGHSVLLLSVGLTEREDGVRRMLRRDVPVIETSEIDETMGIIRDFGIEVLNSHQWHVQKYPASVPDVFHGLKAHVASLHGMIEHGHAFGVTPEQIRAAHANVSTWVYTADKNLHPFIEHGLYTKGSSRFTKLPNGMEPPSIRPIARSEIGMPDDAFVLCCVSRAIPDKGWAETVEAVKLAREMTERDIRLILVGNGPIYEDLRRAGVPGFVHLAGFSDNSVGYYSAADMGIMLTRFRSESFPLTIVDCLFAGKPYISCDVGEIRNMLTDDDQIAGEVVALTDWEIPVDQVAEMIAAYATDDDRYADACAVVPRLVTRYRIDHVVERYVAVFDQAMHSAGALEKSDIRLATGYH